MSRFFFKGIAALLKNIYTTLKHAFTLKILTDYYCCNHWMEKIFTFGLIFLLNFKLHNQHLSKHNKDSPPPYYFMVHCMLQTTFTSVFCCCNTSRTIIKKKECSKKIKFYFFSLSPSLHPIPCFINWQLKFQEEFREESKRNIPAPMIRVVYTNKQAEFIHWVISFSSIHCRMYSIHVVLQN